MTAPPALKQEPPPYDKGDASSILRYVRSHPAITVRGKLPGDGDEEIALAFSDLALLWPDHYRDGLTGFVRHMKTLAALGDADRSDFRLVPVNAAEIRAGESYLALTTGGMGTVGAFIQGGREGQTKATPFARVFRIVQINPHS